MPSQYRFLVPLAHVSLPSADAFRIERVSLVHKDNLSATIPEFSQIEERPHVFARRLVNSSPPEVYAVLPSHKKVAQSVAMKLIVSELMMVHCVQLPLRSGTTPMRVSFSGADAGGTFSLHTLGPKGLVEGMRAVYPDVAYPLHLGYLSESAHADFRAIIDTFNGSYSKNWREILRRAFVLLGRSLFVTDLQVSFLLTAIVLETLFITDQAKHREQLTRAISLFATGFDSKSDALRMNRFQVAYDKRCTFVHQGETDGINYNDLELLRELAFNAFRSVAMHPNEFFSRGNIAKLAKNLEAATQLGIEASYRINNLEYKQSGAIAGKGNRRVYGSNLGTQ